MWRTGTTAVALICVLCFVIGVAPAIAQEDRGDKPPAGDRESAFAPGSTVQLPTFGVAIDADGVLSLKEFPDPGGRLTGARVAAAKAKLDKDVFAPSELRKISLVKLETAVRAKLDAGEPPDEVMQHLAGLLRLDYVFFYPDERDIVVAGPAEGWIDDASGRAVGVTSGSPVVLLEDLIVALRAYPPGSRNRPFIGCTIDPDADGLAKLREFQSTVPSTIRESERAAAAVYIAKGMRDSLGMANIRVFGVSDQTHFAQVLIEADYRMKMIGIGLEPPPVKMTTFIGSLSSARHATLQRWWFTPNYDCVRVTDDRLAMQLVGQGVQLQTEDNVIGPDGKLIATGAKPSRASELYTTAFTKKYPEISEASPVYTQLRNMIDLVVAAAFMCREDYYGRADWRLGVFADERALPVETLANPKNVPAAVNVVWKGSRLLAPAGGGVSILPDQALESDRLFADSDGKLSAKHEQLRAGIDAKRWWWD